MKRMLMTAGLVLGLAAPATVTAHDESQHKGKPTAGEVVAVTGGGFDLKTATGTVKVTHTPKTVFEHGTAKVDKTHVTKGGKVTVFGTKLATGELVAKEVLIGEGTSTDHGAMGHGSADKQKPATAGTKQH